MKESTDNLIFKDTDTAVQWLNISATANIIMMMWRLTYTPRVSIKLLGWQYNLKWYSFGVVLICMYSMNLI